MEIERERERAREKRGKRGRRERKKERKKERKRHDFLKNKKILLVSNCTKNRRNCALVSWTNSVIKKELGRRRPSAQEKRQKKTIVP